ncbi:MAG: class I SAM-dependent methyltransferase [Burkholderiales bacterium]
MNANTLSLRRPSLTPKPHIFDRVAREAVRARLAGVRDGELAVADEEGRSLYGRRTERCALSAAITVHDPRFWSEVAFAGSIGAGEAYMLGYWSADDLTAVVRILAQNRSVLDGLDSGWSRVTAPLQRVLHWLNRNTRAGSRRNISAHYDLGNDFFALFLDANLMYSSAIFERSDMTLEEAQTARLDRICGKLELSASDHLLEIGTGWGGMALHAARHYGCRVTTTTISKEQYDAATERVCGAGLAHRIEVLLEDYRDLRGVYDKLVSLEMIEAVGHAYYDTYFAACSRLLAPDGLMLLQAITIADQCYDSARRSVDFIQRHIFPGSCIPSVATLMASVARSSELRLIHMEDIGPHYAATLRLWRERFLRNLDAVRALGYSETFIRMWEFYLCYCEGGFAERAIGDAQMLLARPDNRR